jgi:hypothetical protein
MLARLPQGANGRLGAGSTWVYGPLRVGQEAMMTVLLRNSSDYLASVDHGRLEERSITLRRHVTVRS